MGLWGVRGMWWSERGAYALPTLASLTVAGNVFASRFLGGNGTAGAPTFSYTSDDDTGDFLGGADTNSWSAGGTQRGQIDTVEASFGTVSATKVGVANGSLGAPSLFFSNDPDSGWYLSADGVVNHVIGGGTATIHSSSGVFVYIPLWTEVYISMAETTAPSAVANRALVYAEDASTKTAARVKAGSGGTVTTFGIEV